MIQGNFMIIDRLLAIVTSYFYRYVPLLYFPSRSCVHKYIHISKRLKAIGTESTSDSHSGIRDLDASSSLEDGFLRYSSVNLTNLNIVGNHLFANEEGVLYQPVLRQQGA